MDCNSEFTTSQVFKSRDALIQWTREVGRRNGFVISIKTSDAGYDGRKARVAFACERSGYYRKPRRNTNEQAKKRRKTAGTKKCGCPFELKGQKLATDDDWMLMVVCGVHNHSVDKHIEGHSYAGRLSQDETSLLVDLSKSLVRPKEILNTLKERDALNATTIKTIYNARHRYKVVETARKSQLQQLVSKLSEHKYIEWHRCGANSEVIVDLFWTHPISVDLLRTYPHVLLIDCSYKTSRYRLPLLEIVGVTSTNMTFSAAFAYLQSEHEDNFAWVLDRLRILMDDSELPNVIVTCKDLALMSAIGRVFPTARHFLCRWHISKNVLTNCKTLFDMKEKLDKFIMSWNQLVLSSTEDEYNRQLENLQREFSSNAQALEYVTTTWLSPYKDKFVAAWTDTCMHFGNVNTNRATSAHANLKRELGSSHGSFESFWEKMHALLELQHTDIKASFEKSTTFVQYKCKREEYEELRDSISMTALELILAQSKRANSIGADASVCGCVIRVTHGLPCAHEIAEFNRDGRPIPLDSIDVHWRKLCITPTEQNVLIRCKVELGSSDDVTRANSFPSMEPTGVICAIPIGVVLGNQVKGVMSMDSPLTTGTEKGRENTRFRELERSGFEVGLDATSVADDRERQLDRALTS